MCGVNKIAWRARRDDLPAGFSPFGAEVNDPVGGRDDVEGGDEEFGVVDLFVSEIVNFVNNAFDLFVWNVYVTLFNCQFQFINVY